MHCVAVCCSVLQCVAGRYIVLPCVASCCSALQCAAVCCSVWQCVAGRCSVLQSVAVLCSVLQCVAVCCRALSRAKSHKQMSHVTNVWYHAYSTALTSPPFPPARRSAFFVNHANCACTMTHTQTHMHTHRETQRRAQIQRHGACIHTET